MNEPEEIERPAAAYGDCASDGEARHIWKNEHICARCGLGPLCVIGRTTADLAPVLLPVVSRCANFSPVE
ncbi:MAG: hypothetical protein ACPGVG_08585 [Mycobacterium sp.]